MNLIIIGASGFVGSHLMYVAIQREHNVIGTQYSRHRADLVPFDITQQRISDLPLERLDSTQPSYGILTAAMCKIDDCATLRDTARAINVEHTLRMIRELQGRGIRPVFLSSSAVFSGEEGYYTETDFPNPVCEYGRHKLEVEEYLRTRVPEALILRLDKIVGNDPLLPHLFSEWSHWLNQRRALACITGQIMSPTLVHDAGLSIVLACEQGLRGVYHVANPEFFSRDELARQFLRISGRSGNVICKEQATFGFKDLRPIRTYLDSSGFIQSTGQSFTSMRRAIEQFCQKTRKISERPG